MDRHRFKKIHSTKLDRFAVVLREPEGAFEGAVFFGDGDPHRFTGTAAEDGDEIEVGLEYDENADTLTLTYPGDGTTHVRTRA
ncbi:hypothetical protein [Glycomyces rhizosphaerae]|uniref:Uncharacterized protein n=1 Tax=Glycomyces rhizosphaerae TaxID=2054422 RepID=A0ABV7PZ31_9ACTN